MGKSGPKQRVNGVIQRSSTLTPFRSLNPPNTHTHNRSVLVRVGFRGHDGLRKRVLLILVDKMITFVAFLYIYHHKNTLF